MPMAASAVSSADVPLAVARQCCVPVSAAYWVSKALTCPPAPRPHLPLLSTDTIACSSRLSWTGQPGNAAVRMGVPPSTAGRAVVSGAAFGAAACGAAAALAGRDDRGAAGGDGPEELAACTVDRHRVLLIRRSSDGEDPILDRGVEGSRAAVVQQGAAPFISAFVEHAP